MPQTYYLYLVVHVPTSILPGVVFSRGERVEWMAKFTCSFCHMGTVLSPLMSANLTLLHIELFILRLFISLYSSSLHFFISLPQSLF